MENLNGKRISLFLLCWAISIAIAMFSDYGSFRTNVWVGSLFWFASHGFVEFIINVGKYVVSKSAK